MQIKFVFKKNGPNTKLLTYLLSLVRHLVFLAKTVTAASARYKYNTLCFIKVFSFFFSLFFGWHYFGLLLYKRLKKYIVFHKRFILFPLDSISIALLLSQRLKKAS